MLRLRLNQTNRLKISEITEYSVYADGGEYGAIPLRDTPPNLKLGETINAYLYLDAEEDLVATMAQAKAQIGECAHLQVVSSGDNGTYLDWGLPKDLLLPFSEQLGAVRTGDWCVVCVYQDDEGRPIASMKLHRHLSEYYDDLELNEAVNIMIAGETELGFKAIINNEQLGLIFHDECAQPLEIGAKMKGWVKKIRDDGKINININRMDTDTRDELETDILRQLKEAGGRLELSDKSPPHIIYAQFNVSKKNFKRALGSLYKKRLIKISPKFIEITTQK